MQSGLFGRCSFSRDADYSQIARSERFGSGAPGALVMKPIGIMIL